MKEKENKRERRKKENRKKRNLLVKCEVHPDALFRISERSKFCFRCFFVENGEREKKSEKFSFSLGK